MKLFLAVDAGGTSTRAVALLPDGTCVGYGTGGGGNPVSAGAARASAEVAQAVGRALSAATDELGRAATLEGATVLAMAGSRLATGSDWLLGGLAELGVRGPLVFENDILAMFCSGAWEPDGYGVVAGTGAAAIRVRDGRPDRTCDGLGWLIGDDGSGFWIGRRVAHAAAADLESRGPATALTALVLAELGAPLERRVLDAEDGRPESLRILVDRVYALRPVELARFAPLAFRAAVADGGDAVAAGIVAAAREAIRSTLGAIADARVRGPVVCGGGVLGALGPDLAGLPGVAEARRVTDGAAGAAVLALRRNGVEVGRAEFERIRASLEGLRANV